MTPQRTARETKSIILNNVVIFNGKEESTVRGSVRIDGNRIRTVSTEPIGSDRDRPAEVIDGQGKFLMPGLIDAHWHAFLAPNTTMDLMTADESYTQLRPDAKPNEHCCGDSPRSGTPEDRSSA